jgi:hypothetical protein
LLFLRFCLFLARRNAETSRARPEAEVTRARGRRPAPLGPEGPAGGRSSSARRPARSSNSGKPRNQPARDAPRRQGPLGPARAR